VRTVTFARFCLLCAGTPESVASATSLGVAPGGGGGDGLQAEDGGGGDAAFAQLGGVGVGFGEHEFAEDGEGLGAGGFEEGVEGELCGGHARRMALRGKGSSDVGGLCARFAHKGGRWGEIGAQGGEVLSAEC